MLSKRPKHICKCIFYRAWDPNYYSLPFWTYTYLQYLSSFVLLYGAGPVRNFRPFSSVLQTFINSLFYTGWRCAGFCFCPLICGPQWNQQPKTTSTMCCTLGSVTNSSTVYYTSPREYNIVSINYVRCLTTYFLFDQVPDIWWWPNTMVETDWSPNINRYLRVYIKVLIGPFDSGADVAAPCELYIRNLIPKREIGFLDIFHSRACGLHLLYNTFTGRWIKSV